MLRRHAQGGVLVASYDKGGDFTNSGLHTVDVIYVPGSLSVVLDGTTVIANATGPWCW